jgi:hypothetical protein
MAPASTVTTVKDIAMASARRLAPSRSWGVTRWKPRNPMLRMNDSNRPTSPSADPTTHNIATVAVMQTTVVHQNAALNLARTLRSTPARRRRSSPASPTSGSTVSTEPAPGSG